MKLIPVVSSHNNRLIKELIYEMVMDKQQPVTLVAEPTGLHFLGRQHVNTFLLFGQASLVTYQEFPLAFKVA